MSLFTAILQGLQKKIDAQQEYKSVVIQGIKEVLSIEITPDAIISLTDGVLIIHTNPTIKAVLLLKKEQIIQNLKNKALKVYTLK